MNKGKKKAVGPAVRPVALRTSFHMQNQNNKPQIKKKPPAAKNIIEAAIDAIDSKALPFPKKEIMG